MRQPLIGTRRATVQWLATLLILGIPFIRVGGESLLRLDAASRTLLFCGARVRIEELSLFLLAVLILVFGFIFVTMVFGRVWCGWLCPQTTLTDLSELIRKKAQTLIPGKILSGTAQQLSYLIIAFVVAADFIWYFIPPQEFFHRLVTWNLGTVAGITLGTLFPLVYLDLQVIRRYFCKDICPYGRIQLMAMDRNTLTLEFDQECREECCRCGSCVKVCPMGIDIRNGLQVECINCGRCLDACRRTMGARGEKGLIHYTFGRKAEGGGRPLNARSLLLGGLLLVLLTALVAGIATRREATLKLRRGAGGVVRRLPDGGTATFFTAYVENRSPDQATYSLQLPSPAGYRLTLLGPIDDILLPANTNRRIDFVVRISPPPHTSLPLELKLMRGTTTVAVSPLTLESAESARGGER